MDDENNLPRKSTPMSMERTERSIFFMKSGGGYIVLAFLTVFSIFIFGPLAIIATPLVYFGILKGLQLHLAQIKFMRDYAKDHNFQYIETFDVATLRGRLFKTGDQGQPSNAIVGMYNNVPIKIFNYTYSVGSGKHRRTYPFTICEVEIEKTKFPYIFLQSKTMSQYHSSDMFGEDQDVSIPLTGGTESYFSLSCTKNYELETMQIFTEELLGLLKTYSQNFSIEFAENKIYFYDDTIIRNQKDLDQLFTVVKSTLDNTGGLLQRLHDDFDVIRETYERKRVV